MAKRFEKDKANKPKKGKVHTEKRKREGMIRSSTERMQREAAGKGKGKRRKSEIDGDG